jgi:hypothetical protein
MAFLGLGSFGEGFVTGFAESANKALQKDIERINSRIDRVAVAKAERALKDQDKRKAEKDTIVDALKRGASIYGDADSQEAIAFAAGVLKEEGNLQAYESFMSELATRKASEPGFEGKIRSLVNRPANVNAKEVLTFDKIADGFLGTKYLPDVSTTGAVSIDDTAVGKLFGGEKLNQQITKRITSELSARGVVLDQNTGIELPESYFDRDKYIIYKMTPEQRIAHYQQVVDDPNLVDDDGTIKKDALKKIQENRDIVDKRNFEEADAEGRIAILTSRYQINRIKAQDGTITQNERTKAGTIARKSLQQLGQYQQGKDIIAGELGDIDQKIAVLRRQYLTANTKSDVPGMPSEKDEIEAEIIKLEGSKRQLDSYQGTFAQQNAYLIDEAIRNGNGAELEKQLAVARNIDAASLATKNIKPAEHSAANSAITNLAMTKLKLHPKFGAGAFTYDPSSNKIEFIGPEDLKEEAAAELKKIIAEVTNDAIRVARTARDRQIFDETRRILGIEIDRTINPQGDAASQTQSMLSVDTDVTAQTQPTENVVEEQTQVLSGDKKIANEKKTKETFLPNDGKPTDESAQLFIQTMREDETVDDDEIIQTAKNISPNLATVVTQQIVNFNKAKYQTAADYAQSIAKEFKLIDGEGNEAKINTENASKMIDKVVARYGADSNVASQVVTKIALDAQTAVRSGEAVDVVEEDNEERVTRLIEEAAAQSRRDAIQKEVDKKVVSPMPGINIDVSEIN